jgi:hypothetical protein
MTSLTEKVAIVRAYLAYLPTYRYARMVYAYVFELAGVGLGYDDFVLHNAETDIVSDKLMADMELVKDIPALPVCIPRENNELRDQLKKVLDNAQYDIVTIVAFLLYKAVEGDADVIRKAHRLHPEWRSSEIEAAVKVCKALHEICDKIPNVIEQNRYIWFPINLTAEQVAFTPSIAKKKLREKLMLLLDRKEIFRYSIDKEGNAGAITIDTEALNRLLESETPHSD